MAKPIKHTPILKGKDAERFMEEMRKTEHKKVSGHELAIMRENYSKLVSIAKFR